MVTLSINVVDKECLTLVWSVFTKVAFIWSILFGGVFFWSVFIIIVIIIIIIIILDWP